MPAGTLEFSPDVEARLNDRAAGEGLDLATLVRQIVESSIAEPKPKIWTAGELLKLTPAERTPMLEAMAKEAALCTMRIWHFPRMSAN